MGTVSVNNHPALEITKRCWESYRHVFNTNILDATKEPLDAWDDLTSEVQHYWLTHMNCFVKVWEATLDGI